MLPAGHPYASVIDRVARPGRYTGGEQNQVVKDPVGLRCRIVLAYPDVYEIGMSHMGLKILYGIVNARADLAAERAFAPWPDMERELRAAELPLVSLESATTLSDFDIVGFSLQYELTYTNLLLMLDLGGIPRRGSERGEGDPLVVAGGPVAFEPEPLAPFVDCFVIGDGEEALPALMDDWAKMRDAGLPRAERLRRLADRSGRYVPSLYEIEVSEDTGLAVVRAPADDTVPYPVVRAHVPALDAFPYPTDAPVAEASAIFDRHAVELARGCTEGCRFCQAGMIYRPVRERSPEAVLDTVMRGLRESGYDEVSLTSLSTADYSAIVPLVTELMARLEDAHVSLAVSSLRAYGLPEELLGEIERVRATSLTFAPEAGTQRLRDVVNKNVSEEQILGSARRVFARKWNHMKCYFMIGLPTETEEDLRGIMETSTRCLEAGESVREDRRRPRVICSVSSFVPKPHTPFQWAAMEGMTLLGEKQRWLRAEAKRRRLELKWHDPSASWLEGILSRGDRRLADLVELAYEKGCRFDSWDERFRFELWKEAIEELGIDERPYLATLPVDAPLPWDHIDPGLTKDFLAQEYRRSLRGQLSPPCGKPKGAVMHPASLAEAHAQEQPLVCFHCGVACDLDGMKAERAFFHEQLDQIARLRPEAGKRAPLRYRLVFAKEGAALALSHLDLVRLWPRALRRAGLRVAYSRGYHPHPLLSFTPALPMGMASCGEQMEILLEEDVSPDELIERLAPTLPDGLRMLECERGESRPLSKRLRSFRMRIDFAEPEGVELNEACEALLARATIERVRTRKGRTRRLDLRPTLLGLRPAAPEERGVGDRSAGGVDAGAGTGAPGAEERAASVVAELAVQGAALKAGELVELLGGDPSTTRALRLGFTLEGI